MRCFTLLSKVQLCGCLFLNLHVLLLLLLVSFVAFFLPHNSSTSSEHPSTFFAVLKQKKTLRSGHKLKFGSSLPTTSISLLLPSFPYITSSFWDVSSDLWFSDYADVRWQFLESAPKTKVGSFAVHHVQPSSSFTNRPHGFFWHNANGKDALHFSLKPPQKSTHNWSI